MAEHIDCKKIKNKNKNTQNNSTKQTKNCLNMIKKNILMPKTNKIIPVDDSFVARSNLGRLY